MKGERVLRRENYSYPLNLKMTKEKYYILKEQGLCVRGCGRKAREGKTMCAECAEYGKTYQDENRKWARKKGLCPKCLKNRLFGEEKTCPECLAYMAIVNKKSREKGFKNSHEWYVVDIAKLKKQGLCRSCRTKKVAEGHTYCPTCLSKKRERRRRYYQNETKNFIPRSERRSYGLCYRCGNPLDSDKGLCTACSESVVKNFKGIRGTNAYWKADNQLTFRGL